MRRLTNPTTAATLCIPPTGLTLWEWEKDHVEWECMQQSNKYFEFKYLTDCLQPCNVNYLLVMFRRGWYSCSLKDITSKGSFLVDMKTFKGSLVVKAFKNWNHANRESCMQPFEIILLDILSSYEHCFRTFLKSAEQCLQQPTHLPAPWDVMLICSCNTISSGWFL